VYDVGRSAVVVGGGIVGLAVARELQLQFPGLTVTVLEKEADIAQHQTGRNSGVVHAGIYYTPGSLKAKLCVEGAARMREYVAEHRLPYDECGKLIVALDHAQERGLDDLANRAAANGLRQVVRLDGGALSDVEPHATGRAALHSPTTAITDFAAVARAMADEITEAGGSVVTGAEVVGIAERAGHVDVSTTHPEWQQLNASTVITCAGLQSDRVAALSGADMDPQIVPFRGGYHRLVPDRRHLVRGLIYPVPDPRYPFLGIHLTKRVDGEVLVGPHAVLALGRERYEAQPPDWRDVLEVVRWPGSRHLARQHWRTGVREIAQTVSTRAFLAQARKYVPELRLRDVERAGSGIRAQALGRNGRLIDDFCLSRRGAVLNVRNAPSPAATSSLAIASHLVAQLADG
jgi:L-2-hydroxyglutarate oxidase LhgO